MRASLIAAACATVLAFIPLQANAKTKCVKKAGEGWGITRSIAEFQSFEIIQQVTGNWPIQSDEISKPVYKCKGSDGSWTCIARATVCKKS
jgi:hypothetical protein